MSLTTKIRSFLCTAVIVIGFFEFFFYQSRVLIYFAGTLAVVAFIFTVPVVTVFTRTMALLLCGSGLVAIFLKAGFNLEQIIVGFKEMVPLVSLVAAVTILRIPFELGKYAELFELFYHKAKGLKESFLTSLLIAFSLSFILGLGSIAPTYYLISQNIRKMGLAVSKRFFTASIFRGYAMGMIISPTASAVGIAQKYTGLSWFQLVGPILILSAIGLAVSYVVETCWQRTQKNLAGIEQLTAKINNGEFIAPVNLGKRIFSMVMLFAGVISSIFIFNFLAFSPLNSIALGCMVTTFGWGLLSGYFKQVKLQVSTVLFKDNDKFFEQLNLFLAAGFFTYAMDYSGFLRIISQGIETMATQVGVVVLLALVPVIIILLAMVGFHPLASGILIAKTISVSNLYYHPVGFALALVSGMSLGFVMSPFSVLVLMMSSFVADSPLKLGFKWNLVFVTVFLGLVAAFIGISNYLIAP